MKHLSFARLALVPAVVGLLAGAATAETATLQEQGSGTYGLTWSHTIGDRFYTDDTYTILRADTDITAAWAELTEPDRMLVLADCKLVRAQTAEQKANEEAQESKVDKATGTPVSNESLVRLCTLIDPM